MQSTSTGKIHPLCSPSSSINATNKDDSENWLSWFWNSVTGQKKCSTRAPENELTEGLANSLSQTFYLIYPFDENNNSDVEFATTLDDGSLLTCEYKINNVTYSFEIPISNSRFTLSAKYFDGIALKDERTTLRVTVKCKSKSGEVIPITDSMNIILLKD
ncbi:MAG: hypothetical protein NC338_09090 [Firmicutes bacterium]|nr:hypothetical protein [Bacillota bacterium]MCM1402136.1 hypothetical protein [Bacteroides sp.]MCM1478035.1 hypothetical protein [Bacteroides sp.]